jgi:hypothetical protein
MPPDVKLSIFLGVLVGITSSVLVTWAFTPHLSVAIMNSDFQNGKVVIDYSIPNGSELVDFSCHVEERTPSGMVKRTSASIESTYEHYRCSKIYYRSILDGVSESCTFIIPIITISVLKETVSPRTSVHRISR